MLNRLEYYLLNEQMDDWEPLFLLYRTAVAHVDGATLDTILEGLVKLVSDGFITAFLVNHKVTILKSLTLDELKEHVQDRNEEELREYPSGKEYYFKPTIAGKAEHAKDIYKVYDSLFPDSQ